MSTDVRIQPQSAASTSPPDETTALRAGLPLTTSSLPQSLLNLAARRWERGALPPRCAYWIGAVKPQEISASCMG